MGFFKNLGKKISGVSGYALGTAVGVLDPGVGGAIVGLTGIKNIITGDDRIGIISERKIGVNSDLPGINIPGGNVPGGSGIPLAAGAPILSGVGNLGGVPWSLLSNSAKASANKRRRRKRTPS